MNEIKICRYKSPLSWISNLATLSTRILLLISGVQGPSKKASPSYQPGCCLFTRLLTAVQNGVFKLKYGEEWLHVAVSVVNIACCDCCDGGNIKNFIMKWRTRPQLAAVLTRTCAQPSRGLATSFSPGMFVGLRTDLRPLVPVWSRLTHTTATIARSREHNAHHPWGDILIKKKDRIWLVITVITAKTRLS